MPRRFRRLLAGCEVKTTFEMGWSDLDNGDLLAVAAPQFAAMGTVDQNIRYQQNLAALPMTVVILVTKNNELATLVPYAPRVLEFLRDRKTVCLAKIHADGHVEVFMKA
jgi:hypothetical protein